MTGYRHTSFLGAFDISRRANLFDTWPIHAETRVCRTPSGWWAVTSLADVRRMCRDQLDARIDSGAATWMERHYRLIADFANYFVPIAEERSRRPGHDLISDVAPGEGEILNTCDAVIFFFTSLGAGIETMSNLMGNAATALMRHPDQMRMVKKGSDLVADALEESLRSTEPADLGAYEHPAASASPSALTTVLPCRDDRARSPPEGIHGELERVAELPALQSTSPKSTRGKPLA